MAHDFGSGVALHSGNAAIGYIASSCAGSGTRKQYEACLAKKIHEVGFRCMPGATACNGRKATKKMRKSLRPKAAHAATACGGRGLRKLAYQKCVKAWMKSH